MFWSSGYALNVTFLSGAVQIVMGQNQKKKELMFLGQAGSFLYFQAGCSSATRSSTSDLTVYLGVQDKLRKTSVCTIR